MKRRVWLVYGPPSVGEFRLGKCAEDVKEGDFDALFGAEAVGLSDEATIMSDANEEVEWTIHKEAIVGDHVLFYLRAPISGIVAGGIVLTPPVFSRDAEEWSKVMPYAARLKVTTEFVPPITFSDMKHDEELFNAWGLIRAQMQSTNGPHLIPQNVLNRLIERHGLVVE